VFSFSPGPLFGPFSDLVTQGAITLFGEANWSSPTSYVRRAQRWFRCSLIVLSSNRLNDVAVAGEQIHPFRMHGQIFLADS